MTKLTTERDVLLNLLTTAGRAASPRFLGSVPYVALDLAGDKLTATGTDPDLMIITVDTVSGAEDGAIALPAKLTGDIVRALSPGALTITTTEDTATLTSGRASFDIRTLATAELVGDEVTENAITVPAGALAEGLRQVLGAASTDATRSAQLTGVLFDRTEKGVRLVATDSYRLAICDLEGIEVGTGEEQVIVPARALGEVRRLIADDVEAITFARSATAATFTIGATRVTTRLLRGPFPDYARLIPQSYPFTFTADRSELTDAVKRTRVMVAAAKDATTPLRFEFDAGGAGLSVATAETGTATDRVDGKIEGDAPGVVAFSAAYLLDALTALTGDEVRFELIDQSKPATISGTDPSAKVLIMPVRTH